MMFLLCLTLHPACIHWRGGVEEVKKEVEEQDKLAQQIPDGWQSTDWERRFQEALPRETAEGKVAFFQTGNAMNLYLSNEMLFDPLDDATLSETGKQFLERAGPLIKQIVDSRTDLYLRLEFAIFLAPSGPTEQPAMEAYQRLVLLRMARLADYLTDHMEIDPSRIILGEAPEVAFPPESAPRLRIVVVPAAL